MCYLTLASPWTLQPFEKSLVGSWKVMCGLVRVLRHVPWCFVSLRITSYHHLCFLGVEHHAWQSRQTILVHLKNRWIINVPSLCVMFLVLYTSQLRPQKPTDICCQFSFHRFDISCLSLAYIFSTTSSLVCLTSCFPKLWRR